MTGNKFLDDESRGFGEAARGCELDGSLNFTCHFSSLTKVKHLTLYSCLILKLDTELCLLGAIVFRLLWGLTATSHV